LALVLAPNNSLAHTRELAETTSGSSIVRKYSTPLGAFPAK